LIVRNYSNIRASCAVLGFNYLRKKELHGNANYYPFQKAEEEEYI
jgi:hypothetical protein